MKALVCGKFECEDYREHSVLCQSCEASDGKQPPCSVKDMCHHCTKEFFASCPIYSKGETYE